jgi:signal transduction histidine kinase
MRFPPPIRITAPLLALVCGLIATWAEYRLNLDLDLARHLAEVRDTTDATARRLARLSERLLGEGQVSALEADLAATADVPLLEIAAIVNREGKVLLDTAQALREQAAIETPLIRSATLTRLPGLPALRHGEDGHTVFAAAPFPLNGGTGWVLVEFDRTVATAAAQADARRQLGWMASAIAVLSFVLWAVLHFGFAARLARLAAGVRAFGEGKTNAPAAIEGGDEVAELSGAFAAMGARLRDREAEQVRLEREVLEISESERRRIGHDLHDGLGQRLTAASLTTNALIAALQANAPALAGRGEDVGRQLRAAIAEARALSHGLAPVGLVDDGLMAALRELTESAARSGATRCVFECPEPVRVADAEVAGHLYRIVQEAMNNALKHAAPAEIRVGLERRGDTIVLEVDDDGEGFDATSAPLDGIGLRVMRYRARLIGGTLEIGSPPAGGTRISCTVKLPA